MTVSSFDQLLQNALPLADRNSSVESVGTQVVGSQAMEPTGAKHSRFLYRPLASLACLGLALICMTALLTTMDFLASCNALGRFAAASNRSEHGRAAVRLTGLLGSNFGSCLGSQALIPILGGVPGDHLPMLHVPLYSILPTK